MKNWNTTGKIKAIIIVIAALVNLFMPFNPIEETDFMFTVLWPFISATVLFIVVRIINAKFFNRSINKPNWNDNPLTDSNAMFEFFAYLFIAVGISMIIGTLIKFQSLNNIGISAALIGIGILLGNLLVIKMFVKIK